MQQWGNLLRHFLPWATQWLRNSFNFARDSADASWIQCRDVGKHNTKLREVIMKLINTSTILAASGALLLAASANAVDAPKDVVKSSAGRVWVNSFNNCVVTKWDANVNECDAGVGGNLELRSVYFDFDSAVLTPAAKAKLDVLANSLASQNAQKVRIVGFADQIGATSYNANLSQRRANAVSRYLAAKGLTVDGNYEVRGLGETASQSKCEGVRGNELKACLWRDRRVEVEVVN